MHITRIEVENIQRIRAAVLQLTPEGGLVRIGGRNGQGKSSVLKALAMALGGKSEVGANPVFDGADHGRVIVDTPDWRVVFNVTPDRETKVDIQRQDGLKQPKPISFLKDVVGPLAIDPLEVSRMEPKKRRDLLCKMLGVDIDELNGIRRKAEEMRTTIGREVRQLESRIGQYEHAKDASREAVDVAELSSALKCAERADQQRRVDNSRVREIESEIADLEGQLAAQRRYLEKANELCAKNASAEDCIAAIEAATSALGSANETMRLAHDAREYDKINEALEVQRAAHRVSEKEIEKVDAEKLKQLEAAEVPIKGLTIGDDDLFFNGRALESCSSSEVLRVSAAVGFAMHGDLDIMLIREGALMDLDAQKELAEMAEAHGVKVLMEYATKTKEEDETVDFLIVDGEVQS